MSIASREGGLSKQSYFCHQCQTHRLTLNEQCCQCKQIIEINDKPEGVLRSKSNTPLQQKEGFEYTFSDSTDNNNKHNNNNNSNRINIKEIQNNISPISSHRQQRKRKQSFNHYPKSKKIKTENVLSDDDDVVLNNARNKVNRIVIDSDNNDENIDLKQNELRITIHPDFSNSDSDSDSLSDSLSVTKGNINNESYAQSVCSSVNNRINRLNIDNIDGYVSESPSLSVISGINGLTFRHKHQGANINKWRELGISDKTIKGLETLEVLNIPQKEGIALINAIRSHMGHVIGSILQYEERLVYLVVGILEIIKLNNNNRKPQVIVVSSRRHAAKRCGQLIQEIGKFYGILAGTIIGGMPKWECIQKLRGNLDVLSGTPGQLCSMIRQGELNRRKLANLVAFVMDDADELVSSESICSQMKMITGILPERKVKVLWLESVIRQNDRQTGCRYIRSLDPSIRNMREEKQQIKIITENAMKTFSERKDEHIVAPVCSLYEKRDALMDILHLFNGEKWTVIYFNSKKMLFNIYDEMYGKNDNELPRRKRFLFCLSGAERSNVEREHCIENFSEDGGILFCSDLLSKGISLPKNMIINFDMPQNVNKYIERCCGKDKNERVAVFNLVESGTRYVKSANEMIIEEMKMNVKNYHEFAKHRKRNVYSRKNKIFDNV